MASGSPSRSSNSRRLEGKVAIVTGGASGIGESTVRVFVENGALVVIGDIQDEKALRLVDELGPHVVAYRHCNVSIECDMESLVAFTLEKWGKLDIMFNNAGILGKATSSDSTNLHIEEFDRVISVNVRGTMLGVKYASKAMLDANIKGSIICTSSIVGNRGVPQAPVAYVASKHAILGIMRQACYDLGNYGIRINCVSPNPTATPLLMTYFQELLVDTSLTMESSQEICNKNSNFVGHSLSTKDIAYATLYLASDDSKFVNGLNLIIDGGASSISSLNFK